VLTPCGRLADYLRTDQGQRARPSAPGDLAVDINWSTDTVRISLGRDCLGGHQGRARIAVEVGDERYTDWAPARRTFSSWIVRV
jgi:hypothetical protein